jgi:hypothetical protein
MTPIATDVWHIEVAPMSVPGGVKIPLASTVIRTPAGVVVYSPGRFDDQQLGAIEALGEVTHIIAPNKSHHLFAGKAQERWPNAKLLGAPGLAAKRTDLKFTGELATGPLFDGIEVVVVDGVPRMNEAVLFHRPTGTLVCADWLFNITKPANALTRFALSITGVHGRTLKQSRVWGWTVKDKAAARASLDQIMEWPIQHVAPVHGEPVDVDRDHLKRVLRGPFKVA